jgi:hypothetical protein
MERSITSYLTRTIFNVYFRFLKRKRGVSRFGNASFQGVRLRFMNRNIGICGLGLPNHKPKITNPKPQLLKL